MSAPAPGITLPKGFLAGGMSCGIKRSLRPDLALLVSERPATAAGLFTTNRVKAAPVVLSARQLRDHAEDARAVVVISGVANAMTGTGGEEDSRQVMDATAKALGIPFGSVLHAATGVIGPRIPVPKVLEALPLLASRLERSPEAAHRAAQAILTTDTLA